MSFPSTLPDAIKFKNMFIMVECTCVRGCLLFLLATVLVWRTGGKPSTWFPPGTRRADASFVNESFDFLLQVHALEKLNFQDFSSFSKAFLNNLY